MGNDQHNFDESVLNEKSKTESLLNLFKRSKRKDNEKQE